MDGRRAIRVRNLIAAFWVGAPVACIWILIADQHHWIDERPALAIAVFAGFFGPIVFMGWLEHNRRKSKASRDSHDSSPQTP
jgi:drug/metabolite transporter (DMT)-like permease